MAGLGRLLGVGKEAEVFAYGDLALKLYRDGVGKTSAFREASILAQVEKLGLPAPHVHGVIEHDGRWGVVMTRIDGAAVGPELLADPTKLMQVLEALARLQRDIHACSGNGFPKLRDRLLGAIARAPGLDDKLRERLLARARTVEIGDRLCHGDFHPLNVLGLPGNPVIVDWLDAHGGSPAADICRSYVLLHPIYPDVADQVLAIGARTSGIDPSDVRGWVPLIAAARLAENVPGEAAELLAMAGQ